jgi:tRNA pseudouridine38-40 synthase
MITRYRIDIAYDGTAYGGWQIQPNCCTVQQKIQEALYTLTGQESIVHGSGRTDRGVHASGQVAHFDLSDPRIQNLRRALNALLPADIRILKLVKTCDDFHARLSARGKEYRYFIWNGEILPPFIRHFRTHVPPELKVEDMRTAASMLEGVHNFKSFAANPDRPVQSFVRQIDRIEIKKRGNEVVIAVEGNGFLYKMVRSIAGHLIRVGQGKLNPDSTERILARMQRTAEVETAPSQGLFLWRVLY